MELRRFDIVKDDIAEQRELFSTCFPETNGTWSAGAGYHRWKFLSADPLELGSPSFEYGAWIDGRLVGYYGVIPVRYKIRDVVCTAGLVCDVMTDPNQQGKGVFTALGQYATDDLMHVGLDFTTGYPIRPEVLPGHLKVGWKVAFDLPIYVSPVGAKSLLVRWGMPPWAGAPVSWVSRIADRVLSGRLSGRYSIDINPIDALYDAEVLRFLKCWEESQINTLLRSENFLLWRLGGRDRNYEVVIAREAGEIVGVSLVRESKYSSINILAILDIWILPDCQDAGSVIGLELRKLCINRSLDAVVIMSSTTTFRKSGLGKALFIKTPIKYKLIIKHLSKIVTLDQLTDVDAWHLSWLDSDNL
jgi:GNAT superfamily N-acetyltransferase